MRFSVQLPTDRVEPEQEFGSLAAIAEVAGAAESAGFDAVYVTEHPIPPDAWLATGGHHSLDPFVALTAAAATTRRLRLHTNILVLPYRNPFLTAKAIASLDQVSGGRVIAGVAAGYLEGEYAALGADFATRNAGCDDALEAMKRAWSGETVAFEGRGFVAEANTARPRPFQQPHPPIWIGGNTRRAMERAVRHGQGWSPFPVPGRFAGRTRTAAIETPEDLRARIDWLRRAAEDAGRSEPLDVNFVPFDHGMNVARPPAFDAFCEQVRALEAVGVTWLSVGAPLGGRAEVLDWIEGFGEGVLRAVGGPAVRNGPAADE